ncbi:hypothetical protein ACMGDM_16935 [Sphingomonas sp. DT-51]|uniref:hypothetical protein n=1 Tax=Sphingomonas sp. DT-51 TaxID=3396165 RepID=UPI003F1A867F
MRIDELETTPTDAPALVIPDALLSSVRRHQAHLAALIESLRAAGVDEATVEASIRGLVDSYAAELTSAVRQVLKGDVRD